MGRVRHPAAWFYLYTRKHEKFNRFKPNGLAYRYQSHEPISNFRDVGGVLHIFSNVNTKIVSEYDQEIPQSQTADNPMAPRGRAAQPSRDTRKTN